MAWGRGRRWARDNVSVVREALGDDHVSVTAAAWMRNVGALKATQKSVVTSSNSWQRELWDYYDTCGEYGLAVGWRANMISRVRLRAAKVAPGLDEPTIVDSGPAADLVAELFGGVAGQSDAMAALSTYLDVPGEGWVVGERVGGGRDNWRTYSSDEIRGRGRRGDPEVISETSLPGQIEWRPLAPNSLISRVWRPHRRFHHEAYSPAKAARGAIRELELVNRHIQAQYLSRLASAGLIVLPEELTFPTSPEFDDATDPFVAEWIETARRAIETPGTAAAVVPIPMRVPAEYVDKVHHIDFTLKIDDKIIEKREAARLRLAGIINVPTELLFSSGSINHWGLWQLEESGVKTYITPDVEIIVGGLSTGYLWPRLRALGEDPDQWVVWYDPSEIISRPNIADNVIQAYDRLEVSGKALRRTIGLDEDDKPTKSEVQDLALQKLAILAQTGFAALHELTGLEVVVSVPTSAPVASGVGSGNNNPAAQLPNEPKSPASGPPDAGAPSPQAPRNALEPERVAFAILQANSQHIVEFVGKTYTLKHPLLCAPHLFSCPFAHAVHQGVPVYPGTSGDYECTLASGGGLVVGRRVFPSSDALLIDQPRGVNGVRVLN